MTHKEPMQARGPYPKAGHGHMHPCHPRTGGVPSGDRRNIGAQWLTAKLQVQWQTLSQGNKVENDKTTGHSMSSSLVFVCTQTDAWTHADAHTERHTHSFLKTAATVSVNLRMPENGENGSNGFLFLLPLCPPWSWNRKLPADLKPAFECPEFPGRLCGSEGGEQSPAWLDSSLSHVLAQDVKDRRGGVTHFTARIISFRFHYRQGHVGDREEGKMSLFQAEVSREVI